MNIYVGNLPYTVSEEELLEKFNEYGAILNSNIIKDKESGRSKGFAFVEMENDLESEKAIADLDGISFGGRNLKVNQARPRAEKHTPQQKNL